MESFSLYSRSEHKLSDTFRLALHDASYINMCILNIKSKYKVADNKHTKLLSLSHIHTHTHTDLCSAVTGKYRKNMSN